MPDLYSDWFGLKPSPATARPILTTKRSPWKYYYVILIGIMFIVSSILVVENTPSVSELDPITLRESQGVHSDDLIDMEMVVVTLKNEQYHVPDCPWIGGKTKRMTKYDAKISGFDPCPYCNEYGD